MKKFFKLAAILAGIAILAVIVIIAFMPWMDRWGATEDEIAASLAFPDRSRKSIHLSVHEYDNYLKGAHHESS